MGSEGGITKVFIRPGFKAPEVKLHLSLVGITFDGPYRDEVRAWVRKNPCPDDELRDEWNSAVDWQGLADITRIVEECDNVGCVPHVGLSPTATFRDVMEEALTSPILEACPWPTLVQGLMRAQGAFELDEVDLEKVPTIIVLEWLDHLTMMLRSTGLYPVVVSIEVWT